MGLSWVSARSVHPKADLDAQESFKKNFGPNVKEVMPKNVKMKDVEMV